MTSQAPSLSPTAELLAPVEAAHGEALAALADPSRPPMDAVVWLSVHLASVQRVVQPEVRRTLGSDAARRLAAVTRETERAAREVERVHGGDATAVRLNGDDVVDDLREALAAQAGHEQVVLEGLARVLSHEEQRALVVAYLDALEQAPTRPHPHTPHGGASGAVAFRVNAWRDRVLDAMDVRHVPTPRTPEHHLTPGRWGEYLLGVTAETREGSGRTGRPEV